MGEFDYESLKTFAGKKVRIRTSEQELLVARIDWVFVHEKDLAYEVIQTNQPERYRDLQPGDLSVMPWQYIMDITLAE